MTLFILSYSLSCTTPVVLLIPVYRTVAVGVLECEKCSKVTEIHKTILLTSTNSYE